MSKKVFACLFFAILTIAIATRIIPALVNNFYFTMDQGNDAVHVREIINRHQILLRGPETGIPGVYHGVLWYYFISVGYLIFGGHPFGAVFMLITLSVTTTAFLMIVIKRHVSELAALTVGLFLQFYWWFYDASRYGFNPFPLVCLSIFFVVFLSLFNKQKQHYFVLASIPIGFAINSEMAASVAFIITLTIFTIRKLLQKQLELKTILAVIAILALFLFPRFVSEIQTNFSQQKTIIRELKEPKGTFSSTNFEDVSGKFKSILAGRKIPQSEALGIVLFIFVSSIFIKTKNKNRFIRNFSYYSIGLILISYLWFGSNLGWRSWHTVYIRPLFFISLILMALSINKKLGVIVLAIILTTQGLFFFDHYRDNLKITSDQSILANEIAAVDWVYQNSSMQGFYVYSYLPSVLDYPYQYLFWWYGTKTYGYVPCEYSTFPKTPSLFVPGEEYYQGPKKECTNLRFLIIEPDEGETVRQRWIDQVTKDTKLLDSTNIGNIRVEKRQLNVD